MGIFGKIFGTARRESTTTSAEAVTEAVQSAVTSYAATTNSGVSVDENSALGVPAYLRALNVVAQRVAIMPFRYMWKKGDIYQEKESDNEHYLLSVQMMDTMSNYQFFYQLAFRTMHWGEALIYPRIIMGEVSEYVLLKNQNWSYNEYSRLYTISDMENGVYGQFEEKDVLHFVWNSKDGIKGEPLWKLCKSALDIYATGDKETQKRFESGGNVKGIISNNQQQTAAGIGNYKTSTLSDLADELEGQQRQGRSIYSLGGDVHFAQLSSSSADMQMTEQQKRVVNEIARAAGVPTYMLYVETSGTQYNTPDVAEKALLTQTIDPMLTMIEREFQRKRVPRSLCHKRIYRFDRDAVYTLDLKSKAEYYLKMQQVGAWSVNDIRDKENMPHVEGGDEILVTANLMTVEAIKAKGTTATAPAASPAGNDGDEGKNDDDDAATVSAGSPADDTNDNKPKRERDARGRFIKQ